MIPMIKENTILKLALAIPTGAPIRLVKEIIYIPPFVAEKTIHIKIIKNVNLFTKFFTHSFSFLNFLIKVIFDFVDFI